MTLPCSQRELLPSWTAGYVYLFETESAWQKIGFSRSPWNRTRQFADLPFRVWASHYFPVGHRLIEKLLHARFAQQRARGEWFCLSADDMATIKTVHEARMVCDVPASLMPSAEVVAKLLRLLPDGTQIQNRRLKVRHDCLQRGVWFEEGIGWQFACGMRSYSFGLYKREEGDLARARFAQVASELLIEAE